MPRGQHTWYTAEQKMEMVQNFLVRGENVSSFCEENHIAKATLYKWVKIYNDSNKISSLPSPAFQDVTPILKQDPATQNSMMKLTLPNGMILEFESSELHQVLRELK